MEIVDLEQGSLEWLEFRRLHIGASDAGIILGVSPYRTALQLYHDKMGGGDPVIETDAMRYGKEMEGKIRDAYNLLNGTDYQPCVGINCKYPWMCASFDGYDGESFIEIKVVNKKDHQLAKDGYIPEKYKPQIAHQFLVSGCTNMIYISWSKKGFIKINMDWDDFDYEYYEELIRKEKEFFSYLLNFTPPKDE